MARPGRPVSESYQPVCCSVSQSASYSSGAALVGPGEEDEHGPIFSISKSSMDVVMATGPPQKRDPAWTRMELRRSSSTNTHPEKNSPHQAAWQHASSTNNHQLSLTKQNVDVHSSQAPSERRVASMQRWSECSSSSSAHSRCSTPETVVWRGGASRPSSLTQEACYHTTPDSPMSKLSSPPTTPSPFTSPLSSPTLPPAELFNSSSTHQQADSLVSSPAPSPSPLPSPRQAHTPSPRPSHSPNLLQPTGTEDESLAGNSSLSFQFPSPRPSSLSLVEAVALSYVGSLVDDAIKELHGPESLQLSEDGVLSSPKRLLSSPVSRIPAWRQESGGGGARHLELPWQQGQSCPSRGGGKSPLVSSLSDSRLGGCCRCHFSYKEGFTTAPRNEVLQEEGTVISRVHLVDAEVQTVSPTGSWWDLKRNLSPSILGSPPGSKLNLKSSVGSNSNLVSPSSSMFPVSSGGEEEEEDGEKEDRGEDQRWDNNSPSSQYLERRRSCLKNQGEHRDELGRRGSMKQVQWDVDGMTWDIHGASVDPEELSIAIKKHLELQRSPKPQRRPSKKKKAPKPPLLSSVVKALAPEQNASPCTAEGQSVEPAVVEEEGEGGRREETAVACRRISRAEGKNAREEDEEVYEEEGLGTPKSSPEGDHSRKKGVFSSLRRPGWCGGSMKKKD